MYKKNLSYSALKQIEILTISALICLMMLVNSCKKSGFIPPPPLNTTISYSSPIKIDMIPEYNNAGVIIRVCFHVTQIGTRKLNLPTFFDTGSFGALINADSVLPAGMVSASGIQLNGQDSINVDGITITNHQIQASYGIKPNTWTMYGNIAYAQITIGGPDGSVTTRRMPFILTYTSIWNPTGKQIPMFGKGYAGIFGAACNSLATNDEATTGGDCKSILQYVDFTGNARTGFMLDDINSIDPANIQASGVPMLTVGVNDSMENNFPLQPQDLQTNGNYSTHMDGTVYYGNDSVTNAKMEFDSGGGGLIFITNPNVTSNSYLQTNIGFSYSLGNNMNYNIQSDAPQNISVQSGKSPFLYAGIYFFEQNEYLWDYTRHLYGFKK